MFTASAPGSKAGLRGGNCKERDAREGIVGKKRDPVEGGGRGEMRRPVGD